MAKKLATVSVWQHEWVWDWCWFGFGILCKPKENFYAIQFGFLFFMFGKVEITLQTDTKRKKK